MAAAKEIDYLTEDPTINTQKYVCLSIFTPDTVKSKHDAALTNRQAYVKLLGDLKGSLKDNQQALDTLAKLEDTMTTLLDTRRSFKVRGSYETFEEAQKRCSTISGFDKYFHVFVGEVGKWLPWEDDPEKARDVQYANKELNNLMKTYMEEQEAAKVEHQKRKADMIERAIKENEAKKEASKKDAPKSNVSQLIEKKFDEKKSKIAETSELTQTKSSLQEQQERVEKLKAEAEAIRKELLTKKENGAQ